MSDLSSAATPQPQVSGEMHASLRVLSGKAQELRSDLRELRRLHVSNTESMRENMHRTGLCIKVKFIIVRLDNTMARASVTPLREVRRSFLACSSILLLGSDIHVWCFIDLGTRIQLTPGCILSIYAINVVHFRTTFCVCSKSMESIQDIILRYFI